MPAISFRTLLAASLVLMMAFQPQASAQEKQPFSVDSANSQLRKSVYFLNAVFSIHLPDYIVTALEQGVDLPLAMEIETYRQRSFWFNKRIVYIKQQYRVGYDALLDEYSVFDVNAGMQLYYPTLEKAIASLTVLIDYPGLDNNALVPGEHYNLRLRFGIESRELPLPLQSSSLLENDWSLASDWFEWELNP